MINRFQSFNSKCFYSFNKIVINRCFSFERAGKAVKPGSALVLDGIPHRITKIVQGNIQIFYFLIIYITFITINFIKKR